MKKLGLEIQPAGSPAELKDLTDRFLAGGFTYFELPAGPSGEAAERFREAVVLRHPRSAYTVTARLSLEGIETAEALSARLDRQLKRLGLEELDYCWLSVPDGVSLRRAEELGAFDLLERQKAAGQVRHLGVAFGGGAETLDGLLQSRPEVEYVQLAWSALDWAEERSRARRCYEAAYRNRRPVISAPLQEGGPFRLPAEAEAVLRRVRPDLSPAVWALRAAAGLRNVMIALASPRNLAELEDAARNLGSFQTLNETEQTAWRQAVQILWETKQKEAV